MPKARARIRTILDKRFGEATRVADVGETNDVGQTGSGSPARVGFALQIIKQHFAELGFSVAALATEVRVCPEHLTRLFHAHGYRAPLQEIHAARVRAAMHLLGDVSLSIYEVARDSGYPTTQGLDRWFRHFTGMTPSEWRVRS